MAEPCSSEQLFISKWYQRPLSSAKQATLAAGSVATNHLDLEQSSCVCVCVCVYLCWVSFYPGGFWCGVAQSSTDSKASKTSYCARLVVTLFALYLCTLSGSVTGKCCQLSIERKKEEKKKSFVHSNYPSVCVSLLLTSLLGPNVTLLVLLSSSSSTFFFFFKFYYFFFYFFFFVFFSSFFFYHFLYFYHFHTFSFCRSLSFPFLILTFTTHSLHLSPQKETNLCKQIWIIYYNIQNMYKRNRKAIDMFYFFSFHH